MLHKIVLYSSLNVPFVSCGYDFVTINQVLYWKDVPRIKTDPAVMEKATRQRQIEVVTYYSSSKWLLITRASVMHNVC